MSLEKHKWFTVVEILGLILSLLAMASCTREAPRASTHLPEKNPTIGTLGETLMFDRTDLFVKSKEQITLKFVNNASAMKHNFVLVNPGKADEIGIAGIRAGEAKDFVPDSP